MPSTLPARSELDPRYTWDFTAIYPTETAWEQELEAVAAELPNLTAHQGHLGEPGELADFLTAADALQVRLWRLGAYAYLPVSVDQADQAARARSGRFQALFGRYNAALSFRDPELLALGSERLAGLAGEDERLALYGRLFRRLEDRRAHVRSSEVEGVLGLVAEPLGAAQSPYGSLTNADMRFSPVPHGGGEREVAQSSIDALVSDPDRDVRRAAFQSYADGYLQYQNTLADLYLARVKQDLFHARVRGYANSTEAALAGKEETRAQLDAVIEAFKANVGTWHRYWAVKRRVLGVERLGPEDVFAPLAASKPTVPYEQAVQWVLDGHAVLGEDFLEPLRRGLGEERWVDAFPNAGKAQGAFCNPASERPLVLMSYVDDIPSVGTLAHELGHAMHFHYIRRQQPPVYWGANRLEVEVPSNCSQALVRARLLDSDPDPAFQLAVLEEAFYNFHRYFFQMPLLARFELAVHEAVDRGEGLTARRLNDVMGELLREGYGGEIEVTDRNAVMWAQFQHLYAPYYTFEYTVGISSAAAIASGILEGRPGAIEGYKAFLSAGGSLPTGEGLKLAGVDISTPEPIERGFAALAQLVDRLERLVG
ncbi:MAG TPA: M3 family oligoendopeptidase [Deinococcales bacterium]|nr:M3 family oligoendopeptidase [Deinococcales bacterium]